MVIAATGDDKVNVVVSLLPRRSSRCRGWWPASTIPATSGCSTRHGVSTSRCPPAHAGLAGRGGRRGRRSGAADGVPQGQANLVEITLPDDTPWGGSRCASSSPRDAALVTILRGPRVIVPESDEPLEGGDELLFVAVTEVEDELRELLLHPQNRQRSASPYAGRGRPVVACRRSRVRPGRSRLRRCGCRSTRSCPRPRTGRHHQRPAEIRRNRLCRQ